MDPGAEGEHASDHRTAAPVSLAPGSLAAQWDRVLSTPRGTRRARMSLSVALALLVLLASVAAWQGYLHSAMAVRLGAMNEIVFVGSQNLDSADSATVAPQLYVMRPDGSGLRRLTNPAKGLYFSPVWSPDGTRIAAYMIDLARNNDVLARLVIMNADGSHAVVIPAVVLDLTNFDQTSAGFLPENSLIIWSPDGSQLVAETDVGRYLLVNADGTHARILNALFPAWSPDGRYLASYVSVADGQQDSGEYTIALVDAQTLQARLLQGLPGLNAEALAWSPDGRYLAVSAPWGVGNQFQASDAILLVRPDGTGLKVVAQWEGSQVQQIVWSPDSHQLAVVVQIFDFIQQGDSPSNTGPTVQVVNIDGSHARQIGSSDGGQPSWSPDGNDLIYANPDDTKLLVADTRAPGRAAPHSLTGSLAMLFAPCWSPLAGG